MVPPLEFSFQRLKGGVALKDPDAGPQTEARSAKQ